MNRMIIDGHAHCAGVFSRLDTLVDKLDELGVDKVVLCRSIRGHSRDVRLPFDQRRITSRSVISYAGNRFLRLGAWLVRAEAGRRERNDYVLSMAAKRPDRIIPFVWAEPADADVLNELDRSIGPAGFRGIKLHQCLSRFRCDDPVLNEIAALAAEKKAPIFVHLYSKRDVFEFIAWARRNPRTPFINAHLIGLELLAPRAVDLPNVFLDVSPAWGSTAKRVQFAAAAFGAARLTFGSDTPFGTDTLKKNIEKVRGLSLAPADKDLILGLNMARLLNPVAP